MTVCLTKYNHPHPFISGKYFSCLFISGLYLVHCVSVDFSCKMSLYMTLQITKLSRMNFPTCPGRPAPPALEEHYCCTSSASSSDSFTGAEPDSYFRNLLQAPCLQALLQSHHCHATAISFLIFTVCIIRAPTTLREECE